MRRVGQVGVLRQQGFGFVLRDAQRAGILHKVGHPQRGQAVLRLAEEIAGAARFEVVFGHGEAVGRAAQKAQALAHRIAAVVRDQDAAGIRRAAPHAAAQLVQRRKAEALGVLDDHDGGVGHVDADLDDGGGDQHVQLPRLELLIA